MKHLRIWRVLLVGWVVLFSLAACGGDSQATQSQTVGDLTIEFIHPPQATLLQSYKLQINLKDAQQRPIDGADVVLTMEMPTMPMGNNQPIANGEGNGHYTVTTVFEMEGDWLLTVRATVNGQRYEARFDQVVVPLK